MRVSFSPAPECVVWAHSTLSRAQKCHIFDACVVSKLCYSFEVASLNASERRRLDGFQARCLRRICKVPPAFISRFPNAAVLCIADQLAVSTILSRQQSSYFVQLVRRSNDDPVRCSIFKPSSIEPKELQGTRRVGRPWTTCANSVLNQAREIAGIHLQASVNDEQLWEGAIRRYRK